MRFFYIKRHNFSNNASNAPQQKKTYRPNILIRLDGGEIQNMELPHQQLLTFYHDFMVHMEEGGRRMSRYRAISVRVGRIPAMAAGL